MEGSVFGISQAISGGTPSVVVVQDSTPLPDIWTSTVLNFQNWFMNLPGYTSGASNQVLLFDGYGTFSVTTL